MGRLIAVCFAGALFGAGIMAGLLWVLPGEEDSSGTGEGETATRGAPRDDEGASAAGRDGGQGSGTRSGPRLAGADTGTPGGAAPQAGGKGRVPGSLPSAPAPATGASATGEAVPAVPPRPAYSPEAGRDERSRSGGGLRYVATRADELLEQGKRAQAVAMLRGLVQQADIHPEQDFTRQALALLRLDDDRRSRRAALEYLQARGVGQQAFEEQLARAAALAESKEREAKVRAWDELSIAYQAAAGPDERKRVLRALEPYLERMVFSRRFTPVLEAHTVVEGDTLLGIAIEHGTTVEAIQRLNGLGTDLIRPRSRLLVLPGDVEIFIDKSDFRLWVTVDDRILFHRPVGLGRDNRTPADTFVVRVKQKDPVWYPPDGGAPIPAGDPRNVLGTRWLGFEDTERHFGFGIHGTSDPSDIGTESSSGCIRLLTPDMEQVYDFIPRGTRVTIRD